MNGFAVEGQCWGIAFFQHSFILGFHSPTPKVEMLSENGQALKTLKYNSSGDKLFSAPHYVHVDTTTETVRIIVSDYDMRTVYMLDDKLQLLQVYMPPSPSTPLGLAAVEGGRVLVGDRATSTLWLLDLTTGRWHALLGGKDGLGCLYIMVYNQATKQLHVGGWGDDEVKVYTVSE